MAVTRDDVARKAGVAKTTVSLILNNHPDCRYSQKTRERVRCAAAELRYKPSSVARALTAGRTRTVGIVLHHVGTPFSPYVSGIMEGVWRTIRSQGYRVLVDEAAADDGAAHLFHEKAADGIAVIAPPLEPDATLRHMIESGYPLVTIGNRFFSWEVDYADMDNRGTARSATESLLAAGRRRILHITGPMEIMSSSRDRLQGYRDALKHAGVRYSSKRVLEGDYYSRTGAAGVDQALAQGVSFDSVFAANDGMAQGALQALKAHGCRVPADVAVVGLDGMPPGYGLPNPITTYRQPLREIGIAAAKMLLERLNGFKGRARERLFAGERIDGGTT